MGLAVPQLGIPNVIAPPWAKRLFVDVTSPEYASGGSINYAAAIADAAGGTIYFPPGAYPINANLAIPANVELRVAPGAVLTVANGVTLSVLGPVTAMLRQWIAGAGTVAFGANSALDGLRPQWWGALADGVTDDSAAIRKCLVAARAQAGDAPSFGIPSINFGGCLYGVGAQIEVPGGNGIVLHSGRFVTVAGFTSGMYVFATGSTLDASLPDGFKINNVTFRDIYIDNKHVGGGMLIQRFIRARVDSCTFVGYSTQGLRTAVDGHELMVTLCQFAEYVWGDSSGTGYDHADLFVGTGIRFETNDNHVTDTVIQLSRYGIYLANSDANLFVGVHVWPGYVRDAGHPSGGAGASMTWDNTCVYVDQNSLYNMFTVCYFDGGYFYWENPWKASVTNSFFLNGQGDATKGMLVFKPMIAGEFLDGVIITGNAFVVNGGGSMLGLQSDFSAGGTWSAGNITKCRWYDNAFSGVTQFFSKWRGQLSGTAVTDWVFDMTTRFPIGAPFQFMWSVYPWGGGSQLFRLTSVVGQVGTIQAFSTTAPFTTLSACNATVNVEISICKNDN